MNWVDAINNKEYATAETLFAQTLQGLSKKAVDNRQLMFIQAVKNAGDVPLAIEYMEKAIANITTPRDQVTLYGWLAESMPTVNRKVEAEEYGRKALALEDNLVCQSFGCNLQNAVVFSLYGDNPKYCETAILNAQLMPTVYPGYVMVVYHNDTVPQHVLMRLKALNVQLVDVDKIENTKDIPGTFWRFFALDDKRFDVLLFRDADSLVGEREQQLVQAWLAQPGKPFHIIRDWFSQSDLILAGMWGARGQLLQGTIANVRSYIAEHKNLHHTHGDQHFLRDTVWPRVKHLAVHHYSLMAMDYSTWPEKISGPVLGNLSIGGVNMRCYTVDRKGGSQPIEFVFSEVATGQQICRYVLPNGQDSIYFPKPYALKVEQGEWKLDIRPTYQVVAVAAAPAVK